MRELDAKKENRKTTPSTLSHRAPLVPVSTGARRAHVAILLCDHVGTTTSHGEEFSYKGTLQAMVSCHPTLFASHAGCRTH